MLTTNSNRNRFVKSVLALVSIVTVPQASRAKEPTWTAFPVGTELSATLFSGRIVRGSLDSRTTNDELHLTAEMQGMRVSSILRKADISLIELSELKASSKLSDAGNTSKPMAVAVTEPPPTYRNLNNSSGHAQSLTVFAHVDNWNSDSELDGIKLYIRPTGPKGEFLRELGTVSVQLSVYRGDVRDTAGRMHEGESWSYELTKDDYGQSGAVIHLPFRRIQPDNDKDLYMLGTLQVRLKISGQGVLDATVDDLALRKRSLTHDLRKRH